jgi:hypothetical protein
LWGRSGGRGGEVGPAVRIPPGRGGEVPARGAVRGEAGRVPGLARAAACGDDFDRPRGNWVS